MSKKLPQWMASRADFDPQRVTELSSRVRRIVGGNPGPMTGPGTNTYLVGREEVVVIDPGVDQPAHIERVAAAGDGRIRWILVTHTHPDHCPGSRRLADLTGAPVFAHPAPLKGMRDLGFRADHPLQEGEIIAGADFRLRCLHTPGHASNHLCYLLEEEGMLFAGDQVMDGATVVIAPPDGDMAIYIQSLQRLLEEPIKHIAPGHGQLLSDPQQVLREIIDHRLDREAHILADLRDHGPITIKQIVSRVYQDVPAFLHPIAEFSVHAHLLKLRDEGVVISHGEPLLSAIWQKQ